jgi:hypothetical protein
VNRRKPRMQTPVVIRYPAPALIDDFVLLFLPPCGLHLTLLATRSLESSLLVSPLLGGPARHRPFAPTLHLYQCKSSRNNVVNHSLHPGATIHRSSDAPVLNPPLVSALTTHTSNQFREKRKRKEMKEKLKQLIKSQTRAKK